MRSLWVDTLPNLTVATAMQTNVNLLDSLAETPGRVDRMTLTRTIIGIDVAYLVHDAGEGSQQVFLGIQVIPGNITIGSGSIPDPFDMTEFPTRGWVWRAAYRVYGFAADQPAVFNARIDLDIRTQRKLENGQILLSAHNTPFEGVATTITVSGIIRQLWLV